MTSSSLQLMDHSRQNTFAMALIPFLLVATSATLSYAYRCTKAVRFSRHDRFKIITAHAFAVEFLQILTLVTGIRTAVFAIPSGFDVRVASIGLYIAATFSIDFIDNRIQLGKWQHPYQTQTLLLTRNFLVPWTVRRPFWKHRDSLKFVRRRQHASSCPPKLFVSVSCPGKRPQPTGSTSWANESQSNIIWSSALSTTFSTSPDTRTEHALEPGRPLSPALCPKEISTIDDEKEETKPETSIDDSRSGPYGPTDHVQASNDTPNQDEISPVQILTPSTPPSESPTTDCDTPAHKPSKHDQSARPITPTSIAPKNGKPYGKMFDLGDQKFVQEYENRRESEPAWKAKRHMRRSSQQELVEKVGKW